MINAGTMEKITLSARRLIYIFFAALASVMGLLGMRKARVIILCYHSIASDDWRFSVSPENFKKQIERLILSGFQFLTLRDIDNILRGGLILRKPSVAITFDDGYRDILTVKD